MARLLLHTFFAVVLMLMVAGLLQSRLPAAGAGANAVSAEPAPAIAKHAPGRNAYGDTELHRDAGGQFHLDARVNGEDARFLVDTGADMVALTIEDAQRMGIDADPAEFQPIARTASGVGYGLPVRIDRIEVGGREIADVDAVVMDGLTTNLLGQSVLRRLGSVSLQGDTMVIRAD